MLLASFIVLELLFREKALSFEEAAADPSPFSRQAVRLYGKTLPDPVRSKRPVGPRGLPRLRPESALP